MSIDPESYRNSPYFPSGSTERCGTGDQHVRELFFPEVGSIDRRGEVPTGADCSQSSTAGANSNPNLPFYDFDGTVLRIPVVVHVLMNDACTAGAISDEMVQSQIDILNEDFRAILGTNGASGLDVEIEFFLATQDPEGAPTTGITRTCNTTWFNDNGTYYNSLAWDPDNYMNIYTNDPGNGILGYVPFLPADAGGALVGSNSDRVVILHSAFGRNAAAFPFNQGRTATHEVGHYLGLEHVFLGCGTAAEPGCHTTGDLICDTLSQNSPNFGCPASPSSCGTSDNPQNYMDYTDDLCMENFVPGQGRRMRCSLMHWRPELAETGPGAEIFTDGFESGDTTSWSS